MKSAGDGFLLCERTGDAPSAEPEEKERQERRSVDWGRRLQG
jgi:hypothetical protein